VADDATIYVPPGIDDLPGLDGVDATAPTEHQQAKPNIQFTGISSAELASTVYETDYIVDDCRR